MKLGGKGSKVRVLKRTVGEDLTEEGDPRRSEVKSERPGGGGRRGPRLPVGGGQSWGRGVCVCVCVERWWPVESGEGDGGVGQGMGLMCHNG